MLYANSSFAFESIISCIDFEKHPSIDYYINLFNKNGFYTSSDSAYWDGEPKNSRYFSIHIEKGPEYKITLEHTPTTRQVYSAYIVGTADKEPFVSEVMKFYSEITSKWGQPDSVYYIPDRYNFSTENKVYISLDTLGVNDTTKIKHFFEQSKPFGCVWQKKRYHVLLEVRDEYKYRYFTDFTCFITDYNAFDKYIEENAVIEAHQKAEERNYNILVAIVLMLVCVAIIFIGKKVYKEYQKSQEEEKLRLQAEENLRLKKQSDADAKNAEFKRNLIDKYGPITRTISRTHYDEDFIKYYDDIIVFEKPQKIILCQREYNFNDMLSCSMYDENNLNISPKQITRTNTGSMLGRAVIGGLTLGVVGAVAGAMTAKTETTNSTDNKDYSPSYIIKIGVKSIDNPTITLKLYRDKEMAEEIYALIQAIIAMKD